MLKLKKCNLCTGKSFYTLYSQSVDYKMPWSDFIEEKEFPLLIEGKLCYSCSWMFKDLVFDSNKLNQLYNFEDDKVSLEAELLADKNSKYRGKRIFQTVAPWLSSTGTVLDVRGRNCDHRHLSYFTRQTLRAYIKSSRFECLTCDLLIDFIGSKILLLRAAASKSKDHGIIEQLQSDRGAFIRSVLEVLHPSPWLSRIFKDTSVESIGTLKT
jgi:hypothetical protein